MVSSKWYYHSPGMVYAVTFFFKCPVDEEKVKAYIRDYLGRERLPNNYAIWPQGG